jgi:hypothetical protein
MAAGVGALVSTGLFASDGIDVAALVAEHLGPRVLPAVLYKPGATPARDNNDPTAATVPAAPTAHKARGFIEDYKPTVVDGTLIKVGDRKVTLLGNTIEGGAVPEGGVNKDQVEIEGTRYNIQLVNRDPAGATYTLQVRKP